MTENNLAKRVLVLECVVDKLLNEMKTMQTTISTLQKRNGAISLDSNTLSYEREKEEQEKNKQAKENMEKTKKLQQILSDSSDDQNDDIDFQLINEDDPPQRSFSAPKASETSTTKEKGKKIVPYQTKESTNKKAPLRISQPTISSVSKQKEKPTTKTILKKAPQPKDDSDSDDLFADDDEESQRPKPTKFLKHQPAITLSDDSSDDDIQFN